MWVPFGTRVTSLSWSKICVLGGKCDVLFAFYTPRAHYIYIYIYIYIYNYPVRAKPTAVRGWVTVPGHATAAAKALRSCVAWSLLHLLTCVATAVAASLFGAKTVKFFFFAASLSHRPLATSRHPKHVPRFLHCPAIVFKYNPVLFAVSIRRTTYHPTPIHASSSLFAPLRHHAAT